MDIQVFNLQSYLKMLGSWAFILEITDSCRDWPDASASAPRSFVARLVKIVSCFSSLTNGWQSESVKKRKRWFKETTEWAEEGISVVVSSHCCQF